jgi:hypothetical protein
VFPFTSFALDEKQMAQRVGTIAQNITRSTTLMTMSQDVIRYPLTPSAVKRKVAATKERILHLVFLDIMSVTRYSTFEL